MIRACLVLILVGLGLFVRAQTGTLKGQITDGLTGEPLFTANVYCVSTEKGTTSDFDGNYSLAVPYGQQTITFSLVGYNKIEKVIDVNAAEIILDIKLESITLKEAEITASYIADGRQTPFSITTIQPKKIQEELASQDLPMVLNSTPGVYATQQGGGDGDARITIRGFNQRNVAVMIDGVPVNDMENGWVYWSNWFGLDMATRSIQVQRGLGASKIAIPSIGGTMNIITKSVDKKGASIKQEVGTAGFLRTSFALSTGRSKTGWGFTGAFSYKRGNGWVEQTFTEGYFYFAKIEKQQKKHLFSLLGFGAPQKHGQRSYTQTLGFYDKDFAASVGADTTGAKDHGLTFNQHWGYLFRTTGGIDDTLNVKKEIINERLNYFHKPEFILKDFWAYNEKFSVSTVAYLSIGNGGGTSAGTVSSSSLSTQTDFTPDGHINFQSFYNTNRYGLFSIDPLYSTTEHKSSKILRSSVNNHRWYGILSTFNYEKNDNLTFSGGLDFRDYRGEHYRSVYDLLGGDYCIDIENNNAADKIRRVGDKIGYHNDGLVRWGGIFGQAEYKKKVWTAFINVSAAYSGYKRIDYFKNKSLVLDGNEFTEVVGYGDVTYYNGDTVLTAFPNAVITTNGDTTFINNSGLQYDGYLVGVNSTYTIDSQEAIYAQSKWKWLPGFTIKGGASYQLNENNTVFFNAGYLSRTPRFSNVIDNSNHFYVNIENEKILAFEIGHSLRYKNISTNLNGYYTTWQNRPLDFSPTVNIDDQVYTINITGINALHKGIELDLAYTPIPKLTIEGSVSLGSWTWQSGQDSATVLDEDGSILMVNSTTPFIVDFDATGVHVGDAAQTQFAGIIRYEFLKNAYVKTRIVNFQNQYANFDPYDLQGDNKGKESWKMPAYTMVELHAGYTFKLEKIHFALRGSILNLFDITYITDAKNNDGYVAPTANFDATSASVFYGMGRRYNISLQISF